MDRGLGHRSDIQGLRAIAVLLVVAAHAHVPGLAGGFVGVDVFFVLSGYLITGLLVKEAESTVGIAFGAFYARRFKRLMPALLLMLVTTCALAWLFLTPTQQVAQAEGAAAAAVWLSNMQFALSSAGYFDASSETNLYLHTWSLGVEEQFYLLWPALIAAALVAAGGRRRLKRTLAAVFVMSFAGSIMLSGSEPTLAFYSMPTRAWQFAAGGLACLWSAKAHMPETSARWIGVVGLGGILGSALLMVPDIVYPGWWALIPSAGAVLVLSAGARYPAIGAGRALSVPAMQRLGDLSYSWYLWHWPVLLLGDQLVPMPDGPRRALMVLISLGIAALSLRFVETPLRRMRWRPRPVILGASAIMLGMFAVGAAWQRQAIDDASRFARTATGTRPVIYRMGCDTWYRSAEVTVCSYGADDATRTAVVMGDSVALQWFPALEAIYTRPGWRLLVVTKSACPMVDEPYFYPRIRREYTECAQWRASALERIAELSPEVLVIGSMQQYGFTEEQWREGTARVLGSLGEHARLIHVLRPTPTLPFDPDACVDTGARILLPWRCAASAESPESMAALRGISAAVARFHNASLVDMNATVCPDGRCQAEREGRRVYYDSIHIDAKYAESLTETLAKKIGSRSESAAL